MKTALCGVWHVHADEYVQHALNHTEVVGAWDSDPKRLENFCNKYSLKAFASFEELLKSEADSVIVCSASNKHCEHMIKLAEAKKNIFTEKVLCLSTEDCLKVKKAVEDNGVKFVISLFQKYVGKIMTVKEVVDSGELGKINFVRFTNCHNGSTGNWLPRHFYSREECGGGAMIDLGAHGMYLIDWIMGKLPVKYSSAFTVFDSNEKNVDKVEDNAITVMTFDDGCIAVNETGFVTTSRPVCFEVFGDKGSVVLTGNTVVKRFGKETTELVLKENLPRPIEQFVKGQTPDGCGIEEAIRLTQMMEGAYSNVI